MEVNQFVKVSLQSELKKISGDNHNIASGIQHAEAGYCPALTSPDYGTVSISSGVNYLSVGSTAIYSCDPGYAPLGSTTRTCEDPDRVSVGTWTGSMSSCQSI